MDGVYGFVLIFLSKKTGKKDTLSKIKVTSREDKGLFKSNDPEGGRTPYQYCKNSSKKSWMFLIAMLNTGTAGVKLHILVTLKPGQLPWWSDWGFLMQINKLSLNSAQLS